MFLVFYNEFIRLRIIELWRLSILNKALKNRHLKAAFFVRSDDFFFATQWPSIPALDIKEKRFWKAWDTRTLGRFFEGYLIAQFLKEFLRPKLKDGNDEKNKLINWWSDVKLNRNLYFRMIGFVNLPEKLFIEMIFWEIFSRFIC